MTTSGLVSIIIPVFNRAELIIPTLTSIAKQSYADWECCIVDDGSTDATPEAIAKFIDGDSRFRLFDRPSHLPKGANSCRNYGFEMSRGDLVVFFDSDDLMLASDLQTRVEAIQDKDIVIARAEVVDQQLNTLRTFRVEPYMDLYRTYAYTKTEMITDSVLFRRELLEGRALFDPQIVRGQEADFFLRIFRGISLDQVSFLQEPSFLYRQHEGTKTTAAESYRKDFKASQLKIYTDNLDYALAEKDEQLARYMYKQLVPILCSAAAHRDSETFIAARKKMFQVFGKENAIWKFKLRWATTLLYITGRPSYRLERMLRNTKLNFGA